MLYRVEKDGVSFHIQPPMIQYYADNGYTIYKVVEEKVTNVEKEIDSYTPEIYEISVGLVGGDMNDAD